VLDDGLGNKIVGWQDGDLAAMELEKWEPPRPARKKATAIRVAVATAPTIPAAARPMLPQVAAVLAPAVKLPGLSAPVTPPPAPVAAAPVAAPTVPAPVDAAEEPEDDDWEWTIAVARARAAAEEAEQAAAQPTFVKPSFQAEPTVETSAPRPVKPAPAPIPKVASAPIAKPTVSNFFQDAPKTQPMAKVAEPAPLPPPPAVATKRPGTEDGEDWEKVIAKARVAATPKTIIPVPTLPRASDPSLVRPAAPVVALLKRVPRATNRIEDTVRTQAAPPANDDKTQPGIMLPPSGGGRRVAAKQK
jgi:hypothetical protein